MQLKGAASAMIKLDWEFSPTTGLAGTVFIDPSAPWLVWLLSSLIPVPLIAAIAVGCLGRRIHAG